MQKIEELTLDAIQADAHAKVQDSTILQQQKTINQQEQVLNHQQVLLELLQAQPQKQQRELDKIQETQTNH